MSCLIVSARKGVMRSNSNIFLLHWIRVTRQMYKILYRTSIFQRIFPDKIFNVSVGETSINIQPINNPYFLPEYKLRQQDLKSCLWDLNDYSYSSFSECGDLSLHNSPKSIQLKRGISRRFYKLDDVQTLIDRLARKKLKSKYNNSRLKVVNNTGGKSALLLKPKKPTQDLISTFSEAELRAGRKVVKYSGESFSKDLFVTWSDIGEYKGRSYSICEELNIRVCQEWVDGDYSNTNIFVNLNDPILCVESLDRFTLHAVLESGLVRKPKYSGKDCTFIPVWNWKLFRGTGQFRPGCTRFDRVPNKYKSLSSRIFETSIPDSRPINKAHEYFIGYVFIDNNMVQYSKKVVRLSDILPFQGKQLSKYGYTKLCLYDLGMPELVKQLFKNVAVFNLEKSIEYINAFYLYTFCKQDFLNYHFRNFSRDTILRCKIIFFSSLHRYAFMQVVKVHIFGFRKADVWFNIIAEEKENWEAVLSENQICKRGCSCEELDLVRKYPSDRWVLIRNLKGVSWRDYYSFSGGVSQNKQIICCRKTRFVFSTFICREDKKNLFSTFKVPQNCVIKDTLYAIYKIELLATVCFSQKYEFNFRLINLNSVTNSYGGEFNVQIWTLLWVYSNFKEIDNWGIGTLFYVTSKCLDPLNFRKFFFFDRLAYLLSFEAFVRLHRNRELNLYLTAFSGIPMRQVYIEGAKLIPLGVSRLIFLTLRNVNWRYFGLPHVTRFIRMLMLCVSCKNTHLISVFMRQKLNSVHFKKHRQYFRFFFNLFRDIIWPFRRYFKLKGVFLQFRGKLAKGGDARKKVITYRAGTTALVRKDLCIQVRRWAVWSHSGAVGCVLHIYY